MANTKYYMIQKLNEFPDIFLDEFLDDNDGVNPTECPFPHCEIMWTCHSRSFTSNSSMPRDFQVAGDEFLPEADEYWRTFWVPLELTDNWLTIIQKAERLIKISGDRTHTVLEGFKVIGNILVPVLGS